MTPYLKEELVKESLNIKTDDLKGKIAEITAEANEELDMQLKPFATQLPLNAEDPKWGQIAKLALHYARRLWYRHYRQMELAQQETEEYDKKLEVIKASFTADRNPRTRTAFITHDPRTDKLPVPSQVDTLVFDHF